MSAKATAKPTATSTMSINSIASIKSTKTTHALTKVIADYAELELEVDRLLDGRMHGVCAACLKPCCKPEYCHNAVESWFLRQVSRHVHGKWWPQDWEHSRTCIAMTDRGCLLRAGRPVLCRSFVCPDYAAAYRDVWEVLYYSFLSDLMWEVGQLSSRVHLDCLPAERAPRYAKQLAARIAEGRRLMARAAGLMAPALGEPARHRIALELLAAMPRFFRASTRQAVLDRLTGGRNGTD